MATMTLDRLVEQLRAAFGDALRAVVLYGPAAAEESAGARPDLDVLVLVDRVDFALLQREAAIARSWAEAGHPPPVTLTMAEWRSSADIFPMEYADVLERHRVLYGEPPFESVTVSPEDLRRELEFEVMGKLLQLRRGILLAGGDRKRLRELLGGSVHAFLALFRALLRAHGETPPLEPEALCQQVTARTRIDTSAFARVVRHTRGAESLSDAELHAVLDDYHAGAEALARHIDQDGLS